MKKKMLLIVVICTLSFLVPLFVRPAHAAIQAPFVGMTADWLITRYQTYLDGTVIPPNDASDPPYRTMDRYTFHMIVDEIDVGISISNQITYEPRQVPDTYWSGTGIDAIYTPALAWLFWFPTNLYIGKTFLSPDIDPTRAGGTGGLYVFYRVAAYHNADEVAHPNYGQPLTVTGENYYYAFLTFLQCWELHGFLNYDSLFGRAAWRNITIQVDKLTGLTVYAHMERRDAFGGEWYGEQRIEYIDIVLKDTNCYQWYEKYLGVISMIIVAFLIGVVYVERRRQDSIAPNSAKQRVAHRPDQCVHIALPSEVFSNLQKKKKMKKGDE